MKNTSLGNSCYCYTEECNQKEWERQGKEGKRQNTVVCDFLPSWSKEIPKCPYCKKKMTVTANFYDD